MSQFLPALAAMLQGAMQKQAPDDQVRGAMGALGSEDKAGSGIEDLLGALQGGGSRRLAASAACSAACLAEANPQAQASGGGGLDNLLMMLDADGDGSPLNDIVKKFAR